MAQLAMAMDPIDAQATRKTVATLGATDTAEKGGVERGDTATTPVAPHRPPEPLSVRRLRSHKL